VSAVVSTSETDCLVRRFSAVKRTFTCQVECQTLSVDLLSGARYC